MRKLLILAITAFVISAVLLGCSKEKATSTTTTTSATTTTKTTTTTSVVPTATTKPAPTTTPPTPAGVVRVGLATWGDEALDPPSSGALSINQILPLYDFLVGKTIDGKNVSTATGLASAWETSADGLTWTFRLRKGVMFDKGLGEVSADDVKFSLERNTATTSKLPQAAALRGSIVSVDVVDQYTVKINLKAPNLFLAFSLSPMTDSVGAVVPKKYVEQVGAKAFSESPVGSGPYRLVKWDLGQSFRYEAKADYWGGMPKYKDLYIYRVIEETTRTAMLKAGELDLALVTSSNVAAMQTAGFKVFTKADSNNIIGAMGRQWEGVLADLKVRTALNLAINRDELSKALFMGRARPNDDGNYDSAALGIKSMPRIGYDTARAKALLAEAGYAGQAITLLTTPSDPIPLVTQAVSGYFQAVGVNTKILPMDQAALIAGFKDASRINTIAFSGVAQRGANGIPAARSMFYSDGRWDLTRDPALDSLIAKAEAAKTVDEFSKAQGDFYAKVQTDARLLFLVSTGEDYAVSSKLGISNWTLGVGYDVGILNLLMGR